MNLIEQRFSLIEFLTKPYPLKCGFAWEITLALLIKLTLLFSLWWVFFAGHKLVVDNQITAAKILGNAPSATQVTASREIKP